jgi:hypothetical protein
MFADAAASPAGGARRARHPGQRPARTHQAEPTEPGGDATTRCARYQPGPRTHAPRSAPAALASTRATLGTSRTGEHTRRARHQPHWRAHAPRSAPAAPANTRAALGTRRIGKHTCSARHQPHRRTHAPRSEPLRDGELVPRSPTRAVAEIACERVMSSMPNHLDVLTCQHFPGLERATTRGCTTRVAVQGALARRTLRP